MPRFGKSSVSTSPRSELPARDEVNQVLLRVLVKSLEQKRLQLYLRVLFALFLLLGGYLYLILGCYWTVAGLLTKPGLTDLMGKPVGHDFLAFWAASHLARTGDPGAAYSLAQLHAVEQAIIGANIPAWAWNYPPSFLLMVLPLSLLPYLASLAVWVGVMLWGYLATLRRIAPHPLTPWLFLAFPGVFDNFFYGQNGFLSAVFLGSGLLLLDSHPFAGGLLLGMLSYKPQLAVLLPVALVAGRRWSALGGTMVASGALVLASWWILGPSTWAAFWHNLPFASKLMDDPVYWSKMPTIFATSRLAGANLTVAGLLQGIALGGAIAAVGWTWLHGAPLALRASVLTICIFFATPYAFEYDLALLGLAFAWLGWEEYTKDRKDGQAFLISCWLALYLASFNLTLKASWQINPLILLAMLFFALYRLIHLNPKDLKTS